MFTRAQLGDKYNDIVRTARNIGGKLRLGGHWNVRAFAPFEVRNYEAVKRILGHAGLLTVKEVLAHPQRKLLLPLLSGGQLLWEESYHNLIVTEGVTDALAAYLDGQTQTTLWYVGLTNATPTPAAGDTMGSHAGWTENTTYTEGVRQTWVGGTASAGSIDNSANKATYSINGTTTVGGAFLTSNNTKGGTTGKLYSCGAFTGGNRSLSNGDTLQVTATFTAADDGV